MTLSVHKEFMKAAAKERARCEKWMRFYAEDGMEFLDKEKLRHEGKFSTAQKGGTPHSIWAFKAWQLRVYGGVVKGNHFICTEIDASKKQDEASQSLLKTAARKLAHYF